MSKSRYSSKTITDGKSFDAFTLPRRAGGIMLADLLVGVSTIEHILKVGERLDHLAAKYMGDDQYWWVIALVNGIDDPFSTSKLTPGTKLLVPKDPLRVIEKLAI